MPEPVSIAVVVAGAALLSGSQRHNTSVSESGRYLRTQTAEFQKYSRQPVSLDTRRHQAFGALAEMQDECLEDGWDGDRAPAVSSLVIQKVKAFLEALPTDIPDPEFAPEPDNGAVSLEWYGGYRRIVSVSIHETDRLAFAAIQGTDVVNGAYRFNEDHIPTVIPATIRDILS